MDNDQRDRREWPDSDTDAERPERAGEGDPTPDEPAPSAAEIESWPSQDAPPPEGETRAWPTEPPEAGSASVEAWPTTPPERGEGPILEPGQTSQLSEPPPSEVEAYPASAAAEPEPAYATPQPETAFETPEAATVAAAAAPGSADDAQGVAGDGTDESTQCPRCGTENRPGLSFCRNCGQRLVAAGVATTVERPGAPEGTMACPRCGTHNRSGVAFCQNCGANLRGAAPGYVPPAVADEDEPGRVEPERRGAVLGPVVLLIGLVGLVTGYLLPFLYGTGSLFERAFGAGGYGAAFWSGYPDVSGGLADQAYFGLAAPVPLLGLVLLALAAAGFMRAAPGTLQTIGLAISLLWSVGLIVLFVVVELGGNWGGDVVELLRNLTPAGIIFFLASLIVLIGTLTRFGRS